MKIIDKREKEKNKGVAQAIVKVGELNDLGVHLS